MGMSFELYKTGYSLTKHAEQRAQQRGIKWETIELILRYADTAINVGSGDLSLRISPTEFSRLRKEGHPVSLLEKCKNVVVIVGSMEPVVITVLHDHGSKNGRCHRKQMPTKSKKRFSSHQAAARQSSCDFLSYAI